MTSSVKGDVIGENSNKYAQVFSDSCSDLKEIKACMEQLKCLNGLKKGSPFE